MIDWENSAHTLTDICVKSGGRIEDCADGLLHVDFANKFLGGGALTEGCVQEEIRFMICPEMILSRLFTEELANNECLIMTGAERFSNYEGYGREFRWLSDHRDNSPFDSWRRHINSIVAIDAKVFGNFAAQLTERNLRRELNKAYCGFFTDNTDNPSAVATGNWGCGAFGGDPYLKALLQLMAAAIAGRPVCYFTFDDVNLCRMIFELHDAVRHAGYTVGKLWSFIRQGGISSRSIYRNIMNAAKMTNGSNSD